MHRIVLIRHGEAAKSATDPDPGLTETGHGQARALVDTFTADYAGGDNVQLVSSPKKRALQTARPIAGIWERPVEQAPAVIEIPSPQGLPLARRGAWIQELLDSRWSQLEPAQQLWRQHTLDFLKSLADSRYHTTLVFCHFVVINSVVAAVRNDDRVVQFHPDYTSMTELYLDKGELRLVELGRERRIENAIQ